jgi:hypothetical protein
MISDKEGSLLSDFSAMLAQGRHLAVIGIAPVADYTNHNAI